VTAAGEPVRRIDVSPARLPRWLDGFEKRHPHVTWSPRADRVTLESTDGSTAVVWVPFPPLDGDLVEHCTRSRRLGLLLVRRGGFAVGVLDGPRVTSSKVGSRHVQGKTKAGGWSQQRFARRRDNQARVAWRAAADAAVTVLLPRAGGLEGLVAGGDRAAVEAVLADSRLERLATLPRGRWLAVPDPRRRVLDEAAKHAVTVEIDVSDPFTAPAT
jgi:Actinobacteria/chloroflexi VLRF1 release factor